jgi:hypothetical protein
MANLEAQKPTVIYTRCMRTGCGRKLRAAKSCARGFGPVCWARLQRAIVVLETSGNKVAIKAAQVLRDGALVPLPHTDRSGVWSCAAASLEFLGRIYHLTRDHCTCSAGQRRIPFLCNHRVALAVLLDF